MGSQASGRSTGPGRIRWTIGGDAVGQVAAVASDLGPDLYRELRSSLHEMLRDYFEAEEHCAAPVGNTITLLGGGTGGYKRLKVRFALPGKGKSGGLRLGLSVDCAAREVRLGYAVRRSGAPGRAGAKALLKQSEKDEV